LRVDRFKTPKYSGGNNIQEVLEPPRGKWGKLGGSPERLGTRSTKGESKSRASRLTVFRKSHHVKLKRKPPKEGTL